MMCGFLKLRNAIFAQARNDYKGIVRGEIPENCGCNIAEIEHFLRSEYCDNLLIASDIDGAAIIEHLHKWRNEYTAAVHGGTPSDKRHYKPFPTKE